MANTSRAEATEASSKASGSPETLTASTFMAQTIEASSKARGCRSEAGMSSVEATEASTKVQGGSSEPCVSVNANAAASSILEPIQVQVLEQNVAKPERPETAAKRRVTRRLSASDLPPVTATTPPQADGLSNLPESWAELTDPIAPASAQTPPLAKIRPRSAGGQRRPAAFASTGNLVHNTPQATRTIQRAESAADLHTVPRGGGLGAVRARRKAF